ncbi:RagB/SusD family nutrient uptake outer membrane protein [Segetibacter sp. 3557_3]|uniref:RagB/SusD family nutrient uptake outer membrane protein n=1 Tax=Segetibacter sp. 3557_3 TaxID=2547429 RepID=UPI001058DE7A|nr:RagB/SusD family nutrient uptake outer membrane protein [Segetibacter sp. 3557_3]TDH23502.1 RagB/SusD family nutrient uptake outer membrane protein [Segetibacter sp. 3557_3]
MKRNITSVWLPITIGFCFILVLSSCKKYLDKSPLVDIEETEPFKDFRNFQGFTEELYSAIPILSSTQNAGHSNWNWGDDEYWEPTETRVWANSIDQGNYPVWNTIFYGSWIRTGGNPSSQNNWDKGNLWGLAWYSIRKANIGIANLDLLKDATPEEKRLLEGQLYFFRGWYHFMLMQYWGHIPYIDVALPTDETPRLKQLSYREAADKVAADLQKAADLLPVNWDETTVGAQTRGNNNFRINKIMALAFLGKNLLYAASPLMNREATGSSSYNEEYSKKAADVFGQALKLTEETGRYKLADFSQYSQIFYTFNQNGKIPGLEEAIFMENLAGAAGRFRWNQVNDYRPPTINNSGIKVYPTANYVDFYGMANGQPIADPEKADPISGYDPQYPWRDRDPRFYHDIMIDGEKAVNNAANVGNNQFRQYASLYTGGLYRTDNPNKAVFTGYMLSKYISKLMNDWDGYKENNAMVLSLLRLSDLYLMYAEAASEGYNSPTGKAPGYSKTAVDAVNFVRSRPGLNVGPVADRFLSSQEGFRSEYRRERAVELAFEGHRFNDLRRWQLLTQRPYTLKKAVEFDRDMPNNDVYANSRNARVRNFRERILFERQLGERHYWMPFLLNDVNMYSDFKQNPGW